MVSSYQVGQAREIEINITPDLVKRFAELSGDTAPLHTDPAFARAAGFAGPLVHGAVLVAMVSRFVGTEFPGPSTVLERIDLGFRKPCYAPCLIQVSGTVKQISEAVASLLLEIKISNAEKVVLASGRTWHRLLQPGPVS